MDSEPIEKQRIISGEIIENGVATYKFEYLSDSIFQNSSIKEDILKLDLPGTTIATATKVIEDLKITQPVTISSCIPGKEEMNYIIPMLGIGGRTFSPSKIRLYFYPENPDVLPSIEKYRNPQIAHELVHVARKLSGQKNETLLDKIINEGLATYYEENWKNSTQTPWGNALNPEQEMNEWKSAKSQLNLPASEDWFYGNSKKHPVWTGYTLGNLIVKSYFKNHPEQKIRDIANTSSRRILEESGYHGLPQTKI